MWGHCAGKGRGGEEKAIVFSLRSIKLMYLIYNILIVLFAILYGFVVGMLPSYKPSLFHAKPECNI